MSDNNTNDTLGQFGKFNSVEDLKNGYDSASRKITEQAQELSQLKETYTPADPNVYTEDGWTAALNGWKENGSIPKDLDLSSTDALVQSLMSGMKEAALSQSQIEKLITGTVKSQSAILDTESKKWQENLGESGKKQLDELKKFEAQLPPGDKEIFNYMIQAPYASKNQIDLLSRLLLNQKSTVVNPPKVVANSEPPVNFETLYRESEKLRLEAERTGNYALKEKAYKLSLEAFKHPSFRGAESVKSLFEK